MPSCSSGKVAKGFEPDQRQTLLLSGGASGRVEHGQLTDTVFSAAAALLLATLDASQPVRRSVGGPRRSARRSIRSSPSAATTA
jgi:hypothetical protein